MATIVQNAKYLVRTMEEKDIPQAIEIDREAFPTQWPHPSYSSFKHELRNRLAHYIVAAKPNSFYMTPEVVKNNGNGIIGRIFPLKNFRNRNRMSTQPLPPPSREYISGFAGMWIMVNEAHITSIAVRNAYRRQGIGELLLISSIDMAQQLNASIVTLEVRLSNAQAQELYKKYGFQQVGIRHNYYSDNGENALIMTTDTISSRLFCDRFQQLKNDHYTKWTGC